MDDHLERISTLASSSNPMNFDHSSILSSMVSCLSPEEAFRAFDITLEQPYFLRRWILRELCKDAVESVREWHVVLFDQLLDAIGTLPSRRRASAAGTLLELAAAMGPEYETTALDSVIAAPQATVRRKAFTFIRHLKEPDLPESLSTSFDAYGDVEAARLLVQRGSVEDLRLRVEHLESVLGEQHYFVSRLYIRLAEVDETVLERLRVSNPVSHAYVCAKLGIALETDYIVGLYRSAMFSEESGLLAWCCGQLGLWDALVQISELAADPPDSAYRRFRE